MTQPLQEQSQAVVQVRRLNFGYADRLVLKNIDLAVPAGATLGLIGPNGGGKTTLIRLLVGLLKPNRGEILVQGESPAKARALGDIGYVPQKPELNLRMPISVQQFIDLASQEADKAQTQRLVSSLGLQDLLTTPIGELSGGQVQRLLIARALVNRPGLLVLDEPTTGIDVGSRHQFIHLLERLKDELKLTIIMSTHDLQVLRALCNDIACLNLTCHLHHRKPGEAIPLDETTCSLVLPG